MKKIIERFVEFPIYANLIILFVLLTGTFSLFSLKMGFFPENESRIITVSVFYPGASPVEMEEGVTSRIEEAVRGLIGIKEINSTSVENSSRVTIETTGEYDINEILMEVKNAVDGISSLPSAAERPIVAKRRSRASGISMVLFPVDSTNIDLLTLKDHAQHIEEDFLASGVMSQVTISGFPPAEISVEISDQQLLRYNLSFNNIIQAIQNNNRDVSGGEIKSDKEELLIRLRSRSTSPDKIGDIIVYGTPEGGQIRIKDVASVKKTFSDVSRASWFNGKRAITISVEKLPEEDLVAMTDFARDYISEFNAKKNGLQLEVSRAFLDILKSRLNLLIKNGIIGLILIIVSLTMFLNYRLSFWVAIGIPFSFLAMFVFANLYGLSINMVSLFGMIIVIGILVDDGIVIAENVFVHFENGKTPMRAAVEGTFEVLPAVATSVITTIIAFTPLLFLQGTVMEMMTDVALVVIASLACSLFEAFFVLPAHLGNKKVLYQRDPNVKRWGIKKYFERFLEWMRDDIYHYVIVWVVKHRFAVMGIPAFLVLITIGLILGGHIKSTLFAVVDYDTFEINVAFTPGDGESQTIDMMKRFEIKVWEVNNELVEELNLENDIIERVSSTLGSAFSGQESGAHAGTVRVYPIDLEGVDISGIEIANRVRSKIGQVPEARKFTIGSRNRFGSPVSIGLMSKNLIELESAKNHLMEKLTEMPDLKDITENVALGKQEVRFKLKPKAYFLGLNESMIADQVRQGFYGGQAQRLQEGRDELRIWVRYPKSERLTLGQMEKMKIKTSKGEYPLLELVDYQMERGPVAINRYNGAREIRVEAELLDPYASVTDILTQIDTTFMPEIRSIFPGVRYAFQGQQKNSNEALTKIRNYFVMAFVFIVFIIIIHFKSFQKSLIIMMMIPLSILGVLWGHGIHAKPLSMMSLFGMVALMGVIINNAIIFLAKYDGLLIAGKKVMDAIVEAGKSRLRPILLTTITTSVGLFPIVFQKSVQAQFLIPMAISLAYGVAIGTIFILLFFPVLIILLNDFKRMVQYVWHGTMPEREEVEVALKNHQRKLRYETNKRNEIKKLENEL